MGTKSLQDEEFFSTSFAVLFFYRDEDLENVRYLQYVNSENNPIKTLEDVSERNNSILKEVLLAKARLRSRAIYNPAEVTWCAVMQNYKNEPALPGIQWQCLN